MLMLDHLCEAVKRSEVLQALAGPPTTSGTFDELVGAGRKEAEDDEGPRNLGSAEAIVDELEAEGEGADAGRSLRPEGVPFSLPRVRLVDAGPVKKAENRVGELLELKKVEDTMIGNLLGSTYASNPSIGPAKTPKQRQAYGRLFEILDPLRDEILAEASRR